MVHQRSPWHLHPEGLNSLIHLKEFFPRSQGSASELKRLGAFLSQLFKRTHPFSFQRWGRGLCVCRRRRVLILAHRLRQERIGEITYTFRFRIQKEIKLASCFFGSFSPSSVVFGGFFGSPLNFFFPSLFYRFSFLRQFCACHGDVRHSWLDVAVWWIPWRQGAPDARFQNRDSAWGGGWGWRVGKKVAE